MTYISMCKARRWGQISGDVVDGDIQNVRSARELWCTVNARTEWNG